MAIWFLPKGEARASTLDVLLARLAQEGRHDVLVEGGPTLGGGCADRGLVDELWLFVAPPLLGEGGRRRGRSARGDERSRTRWELRARADAAGWARTGCVYGRPARATDGRR